ncbi:MAG: DinB family protein [Formosimonas sp.]
MKAHFELLAQYNLRMNKQVYTAAQTLPIEQHNAPLGAFFGSILGTLNHIAVGDTIWLKRFAVAMPNNTALSVMHEQARPSSLNATLFDNLDDLYAHRQFLDDVIVRFVTSLNDEVLQQSVHYHTMRDEACTKNLTALLLHFFNHQTHHRGQVSTLLSQQGVDIGVTDFVALIPNDE